MRGLSNHLIMTVISLPRVYCTQLRVNRMLLMRRVGLNLNEINTDKGCKQMAQAYHGSHCKRYLEPEVGGGVPNTLLKFSFFG